MRQQRLSSLPGQGVSGGIRIRTQAPAPTPVGQPSVLLSLWSEHIQSPIEPLGTSVLIFHHLWTIVNIFSLEDGAKYFFSVSMQSPFGWVGTSSCPLSYFHPSPHAHPQESAWHHPTTTFCIQATGAYLPSPFALILIPLKAEGSCKRKACLPNIDYLGLKADK